MSRFVSHSLVLSLCLLLSLPTGADAFLKIDKAGTAAGFNAVSESPMTWADAKAWCEQQGGRLPLINGAVSQSWGQVRGEPGAVLIDGFGPITTGPNWPADWTTPWPSGLSSGYYWTGTERNEVPDLSWIVRDYDTIVRVSDGIQSIGYRVACVP